jgi:ketosteroid isomerase-like protein
MSQENVEVVRRWLDAWVEWFGSGRDPDQFDQLADRYMAPNVVYEEDPVWPDAGVFRGRDAVSRRFIEYIDLVHVEGTSAGEVIDAGDLVLAKIRIEMLGTGAGEAVEFLWTYTVRVEESQVTHFRAWYDPGIALEAAGLRE